MNDTQNQEPAAPPAKKLTLFDHIKALFEKEAQDAEQEFAAAWHDVGPGVEKLLKTELGSLAMTAVTNAQALNTGTEKAAAAATAITTAAEQAGITVKTSIVNTLVELATQKLQGGFGSAPAA